MTTLQKLALLLFSGSMLLSTPLANAQTSNVTRLVLAFPPGGPTDSLSRQIAEQLGVELGQSIVIENRPGGNGAVAAQFVLNAPNDGKTLWLTTAGAITVNPGLYPKLAYDVKSFVPVSLLVNNQEVLVVNPKNPANDPAQFIKEAIANKNGLNITSSGIGSMPHMAIELLRDASGDHYTHIPNKGAAPAITDVMGGQVDAFFGDIPGVLPFIQAGSLKAIGIASTKRFALLPNVKTFDEIGVKGIYINNWSAIYVSKQVPTAVIEQLNKAIVRTLSNKTVRDKLLASGTDPEFSTAQEMGLQAEEETKMWKKLVQKYNIKAD
jgi:tripartite-type tricarboxylate transporter receptor subunit TctC